MCEKSEKTEKFKDFYQVHRIIMSHGIYVKFRPLLGQLGSTWMVSHMSSTLLQNHINNLSGVHADRAYLNSKFFFYILMRVKDCYLMLKWLMNNRTMM